MQNRIDTAGQLLLYKDGRMQKIEGLTQERKELYRKRRTVAFRSDEGKQTEIKQQMASLSRELSRLRREVRLCDDILLRSGVIKEKLKAMRESREEKRKEKKQNEQFR